MNLQVQSSCLAFPLVTPKRPHYTLNPDCLFAATQHVAIGGHTQNFSVSVCCEHPVVWSTVIMEHNFRLTQLLKEAYRKSRHGVASLADLKMALSTAVPTHKTQGWLRQFDVPLLKCRVIWGDIFQEGEGGGCASYQAWNTLNKKKHVYFCTFVI